MARKIGQAIAGGVGGIAIAAVGYNSTTGPSNRRSLNGIHGLATLVPAVIYLVIFLILVFLYPLKIGTYDKLASDLAERRKAQK